VQRVDRLIENAEKIGAYDCDVYFMKLFKMKI